MILNHKEEEISILISNCSKIWEILGKERIYQRFLALKMKNSKKKAFFHSMASITKSFMLEKNDLTRFIGREIKRVKELEH